LKIKYMKCIYTLYMLESLNTICALRSPAQEIDLKWTFPSRIEVQFRIEFVIYWIISDFLTKKVMKKKKIAKVARTCHFS